MTYHPEPTEGLRERKRRETLKRISETALDLFLKHGYEATTLDEIAAQSGIARRTFFYYFKSKEEILMAFIDGGLAKSVKPALIAQGRENSPLTTVRSALIALFSTHDPEKALAVYKLLESTEALKARMQSVSIEMENSAFEALCELWPEPQMRDSLRMIAMVSIGAMRIAKEAWRQNEAHLPLVKFLQDSFEALEKTIRESHPSELPIASKS